MIISTDKRLPWGRKLCRHESATLKGQVQNKVAEVCGSGLECGGRPASQLG